MSQLEPAAILHAVAALLGQLTRDDGLTLAVATLDLQEHEQAFRAVQAMAGSTTKTITARDSGSRYRIAKIELYGTTLTAFEPHSTASKQ